VKIAGDSGIPLDEAFTLSVGEYVSDMDSAYA
jgi:hypothetical protein